MKTLIFDIETAPNLAYVWGKYEQNVLQFEREFYMLAVAWKWLGQKRSYVRVLPDYKTYKKDKFDDRELAQELWDLFDEADVVVAHNGDRFDIRKAQGRFVYHKMDPPAPFQSIDTLKVARKYFNFNSNKLDDLGKLLGLGRKVSHGGWDLWAGCLADDKKAWNLMRKYNKQDILLLEDVYLTLRPWMTNHPNHNVFVGEDELCPICGEDSLQRRGTMKTRVTVYRRYHCQSCGGWSKRPISNKTVVR